MEITFRGGGGGGGDSGASNFVQKPDNLRSKDTFEGLLGVCAGPIKGPVDGMQSIRVNDTPIEDASGNLNFENFLALFADGDPLKYPQICTLRLGAAGAPLSVNVTLDNPDTTGAVPGPWITRTVTETGAEAIDLRFIVQQLFRQDKNGIYDNTADIELQMKPVGTTTWINPFLQNGNTYPDPDPSTGGYPVSSDPTGEYGGGGITLYQTQQSIGDQTYVALSAGSVSGTDTKYLTITGKTSSPYVKELRVRVPNSGTYANKGWDLRVRLVEPASIDADPNFEKRTISWESLTAVFNPKLGDNEEWRGFAWLQLYGKASDSFSGVPEVTGIYDTKVVQVPPLYVFNPDTRTYSTAIWDGSWSKAYTNDPAWCINDAISDSISGVARLVPGAHLNKWDALELSKYCSEQVSDGNGGTHCRFSMNLVVTDAQRSDDFIRYMAGACGATAWDNGDGEWRCLIDKPQSAVDIHTSESIEGEFIYSHTDIDTRFNDVSVTFLNEEFDYREDRVRLTDDDHIAKYGRKPTKVVAIGCTNRQQAVRWAILKLRSGINEFRAINFTTNRRGKLIERFNWILIADGSLATMTDDLARSTGRIVQNKGGSIVLRDSVRLETGVAYQLYFTVPNPAYNPDTTTSPTDDTYAQPTITMTRNITNTDAQRGDVTELFLDAALPASVAENANVALAAPGLPSLPVMYRVLDVKYSDDGERVTISAINIDTGKYTASDTANYDYQMPGYGPKPTVIPPPGRPDTGMLTLTQVTTPEAVKRVLNADWLRPDYSGISGYRIEKRYNGGAWTTIVPKTLELHYDETNPPDGFHEFRVYTIGDNGRESLPLEDNIAIGSLPQWAPTGQLTNPAIIVAASSDGATFDLSNAWGVYDLYSPSGPIVEDMTFEVIDQVGVTATIDATGTYHITGMSADSGSATFRAHWFDYQLDKTCTVAKSKQGLPGTPGEQGPPGTTDTEAPAVPTGLQLTSSVEMDIYGNPWIKLDATWNANTEVDLAGYVLALQEAGGGFVEYTCGPLITEFYWPVQPGVTYGVKIRAFDQVGNTSAYSAVVTLNTVNDTTPPGPPTNLTADAAFQTVFLGWTSPSDADTAWIDIYEGDSNDSAAAVKLNTVRTEPNEQGSFARTGLDAGTTKWYFLKAADVAGNRSVFSTGISVTTQQVFSQDISGELQDAQIASLAAEKITGQLTDAQLADIAAAKLTGQITAEQIADGSIAGTKLASGLQPIYVVDVLPDAATATEGQVVMLTTDGKLYRFHAGAWTASVPSSDLTGQISGTQITDNSITSNQIAADTITADQIAAGAITAGKIAADAITAGQIAAGAITASELAAGAVTAGKIAAGSITATELAAGSITSAKIAADTITAGNIAAGAITATELAAGSVVAAKIAAGSIDASKIVAASITGDRIAANTISSANIEAGSITSDRIAVGTIAADRLNVATLSSISATIGLLRTASTGSRVELESNQMRVYGANNALLVRIGVW